MTLPKLICFIPLVSFRLYFAEYVNIAVGKYAHQSSTLFYNSANWTADKALVNQLQYSDTCHCCSLTKINPKPQWWELDLGRMFDVSKIKVYGRQSAPFAQSQPFVMYISNTTKDKSTEVFHNKDIPYGNGHFEKEIQQQTIRFIYIEKNNEYTLTLCEVKVFIDCHCFGGPCDSMTGLCAQGCLPGYMGISCTQTCTAGTYGQDCLNFCHCQNMATCNHTTGVCPGNQCAEGWFGESCDQRNSLSLHNVSMAQHYSTWVKEFAIDGDIRRDANKCKCCAGTNYMTDPCLQVDLGALHRISTITVYGRTDYDGHDQSYSGMEVYVKRLSTEMATSIFNVTTSNFFINVTMPRYTNARFVEIILKGANRLLVVCDIEVFPEVCPPYRYGENCDNDCHCREPTCNDTSGICPSGECEPGYQLPTCSIPCYNGYYGDCNQMCGNCRTTTVCNKTNGYCSDCKDGYQLTSLCKTECLEGTYGYHCKQTCSNCLHLSDCNKVYGTCSECQPGYKGPKCDTPCDDGTYGNCSQHCGFCKTSCGKPNGHCDDCNDGYTLPLCQTECMDGKYGYHCGEDCGYCLDMTKCNNVDGTCPECQSGYQGPKCDTPCDDGTYGDCTQHCGSCKTSCETTNGHCDDCNDGYIFPLCQIVCSNGTYGHQCSNNCGQCLDMSQCNNVGGTCPECQSGYQGPKCDTPCNAGSYGNCSQRCGSCKASCDKTNGHCDDCIDGYIYPLCQTECKTGTYGHHCTEKCVNCLDIDDCSTVDGTCPLCQAGYQETKCDTPCTDGYFGFNCSTNCTNCNETKCDFKTGACDFGCSKGFSGSKCEPTPYHQVQQEDGNDGTAPAVIAAGASVGLLVVVIVVVGLIIVKRKGIIGKPNQANRKSEQFNSLRNPELSFPVVEAKKPAIAVKPKTKATVKEQHEMPTVANDYYSFTPRKDDIKLYQLWDYIKNKMADEKKLFYEEFAQLDTGLVMVHKMAMLPENRVKNRYREMYAYDHSRVPLVANMEGESEYINACFIDGFEKPAKFIASQGATKFMIDDFWRMVWQQKSNTIVMLTNLIEMGTEKCMQYWPTEGSKKFESISVKLMKEETCVDYVVRHLQIKENEDDYRQVTQYHFKSWPDKDVPDSSWCLVNFWRTVCADKKVKGPIVVHCSAGVGRTGTFIAIDNIYNQALAEGNVRPLQIVEALRRQRVNMVQTMEQYVYLHEAVADALYFGTHFIWTKQFEDVFRFMKQTDLTSSISRLETQYNLICESIEKREVQEENEYSNVDTISTEMDAYRPKSMNCNKGIGGAIEAVCLPNITGLDAFVVTDTPVDNSCADFWRLIEDQNIKTIITITSDTTAENNVMRYIGSKGSPTVGKFDVNALDEKKRSSFIDRNFTFKESNKDIDELITVKMFEFSAWRDNEETPGDKQSVLDLLDAVYRWQPQSTDKQPILVYSGEGINKSGVVCALMNELHRMRQNGGHINIVETVKTMKQRDRDLIANFDQYRYCHDVILHHINQTEVYQNI